MSKKGMHALLPLIFIAAALFFVTPYLSNALPNFLNGKTPHNTPLKIMQDNEGWQVIKDTDGVDVVVKDRDRLNATICILDKGKLGSRVGLYDRRGRKIRDVRKARFRIGHGRIVKLGEPVYFGRFGNKRVGRFRKIRDVRDIKQDIEENGFCFTTGKRRYVKFGSHSTIMVYQNMSLVNYKYDTVEVNASLFECKENWTECGVGYPDVVIVNSKKLKFGAIRYNATSDMFFQYRFESTKPIHKDRAGYYVVDRVVSKAGNRIEERHYINTADICSVRYNATTNKTFNPECHFNLSSVVVSSYFDNETNSTISNYHYLLDVYFKGKKEGSNIFIDPSYYISSFVEGESYEVNVTQEKNYSHLDIGGDLAKGLVLYMPFDVNESVVSDYSPYHNDGTRNGGVKWTSAGRYGGAFQFDGVDDYIDCGDGTKNITKFPLTVSVWVYVKNSSARQRGIVNKYTAGSYNGWQILLGNNYKFAGWYFGNYSDNVRLDGVYQPEFNKWYHVAMVVNYSGMWFYVDGVQQGYAPWRGSPHYANNTLFPIKIGVYGYNPFFNGTIDEVMIWNRSLSAEEIQELYNETAWRFKKQGEEVFKAMDVNVSENQSVVVTAPHSELLNTTLQVRLGEWNPDYGYNDSTDPSFINDGLVLYLHFDNRTEYGENSTYAVDFSGLGNNGTFYNGAHYTTGKYGLGAGFDGVNDYIDAGNDSSLDITGNITLAAWIYKRGNPINSNWSGIISKWIEYRQYLLELDHATPTFWIGYNGNKQVGLYSDINISLNRWYFIVATYDKKEMKLYINGDLNAIKSFNETIEHSYSRFYIGVGGDYNQVFNGTIDEVMIWNRSLSADEIKKLYVMGRAKFRFSEWQNMSARYNLFSINKSTTKVLPEFRFKSSGFYTPILKPVIDIDVVNYTTFSQGLMAGWGFRKPVTINNSNNYDLTDYQVKIDLDTKYLIDTGKMRTDCGDLRVTDSDGNSTLPYWIEEGTCNTHNTYVWTKVNVSANSNKTIYVYYGNPNAESEANGSAVFEFFDDFDENSLDTNKWTLGYYTYPEANYTLQNGYLKFWGDNTWRAIHGNYNISVNDRIVAEAKIKLDGGFSQHFFYLFSNDNKDSERFGLHENGFTDTNPVNVQYGVGNNNYSFSDTLTYIYHNWVIARIIKSDTYTMTGKVLDLNYNQMGTSFTTTQVNWTIGWWINSLVYNENATYWDFVRVRKYADSDPAVGVGVEEYSSLNLTNQTNQTAPPVIITSNWTSISFVGWFKDNGTTIGNLFSYWDTNNNKGLKMTYSSDREINITISGENLTRISVPFSFDNWTMISFIYANNIVKIYDNDRLVNTTIVNDTLSDVIGRADAEARIGDGFRGYADNIRIYKRAITDQEIETMVNRKSEVTDTDIRRYLIPMKDYVYIQEIVRLKETYQLPPCNSSMSGAIAYSQNKFYGCDGSTWNQL